MKKTILFFLLSIANLTLAIDRHDKAIFKKACGNNWRVAEHIAAQQSFLIYPTYVACDHVEETVIAVQDLYMDHVATLLLNRVFGKQENKQFIINFIPTTDQHCNDAVQRIMRKLELAAIPFFIKVHCTKKIQPLIAIESLADYQDIIETAIGSLQQY